MNLDKIARAVEAYEANASQSDIARLEFFKGLYGIEQHAAERIADASPYALPDDARLAELYWAGSPVIAAFPVAVDKETFAQVAKEAAEWTAGHAGLEAHEADVLSGIDWSAVADAVDLSRAGSQPAAFLEDALEHPAAWGFPEGVSVPVTASVLVGALRAFLQPAAEEVMAHAPAHDTTHNRPLRCPVCGMPAALSIVGDSADSEGKGRRQYCSLCGSVWSFERIRCGSCGSRNQGHLHYRHLDGDPAHRLHTCDECGGYQRVVFQDELSTAPCPEVEDVVMARLDQVANDPRFLA